MSGTPNLSLTDVQIQFVERHVLGRKLAFPSADGRATDVVARLAAMREDVRALPRGETILEKLDAAVAAGQLANVGATLDKVEALIPAKPLLPVWRDARADVGTQIGALEAVLKESKWPLFKRIGEFGLAAFTGRKLTSIEVAIREYDSAAPDAKPTAAVGLQSAVAEMQSFVGTDDVIDLLDGNPLGVKLTLRDTLSTALGKIDAEVQRRSAAP